MSQQVTIETVSARFQDWREKKIRKHSRIPEHLRAQAVELAKFYPRSKVLQTLRISNSMLTAWEQPMLGSQCQGVQFFEMKIPSSASEQTVKVEPELQRKLSITLTGSNGCKLELEGQLQMSEILELSRSFLGGLS